MTVTVEELRKILEEYENEDIVLQCVVKTEKGHENLLDDDDELVNEDDDDDNNDALENGDDWTGGEDPYDKDEEE